MNNYTDEELDELSDFEKKKIINETFESWKGQVERFSLTDIGRISELADVIRRDIRISIDKKFQNLSEDELFDKTLLYKKISYDNVEQFYKLMYEKKLELGKTNGFIVRKRVKDEIKDLKSDYGREYSSIFENMTLQLLGENPRSGKEGLERKINAAERLRASQRELAKHGRVTYADYRRRPTAHPSNGDNDEFEI